MTIWGVCAVLAVVLWPAGTSTSLVLQRRTGAEPAARLAPATPHGIAEALVLLALALRSGMGQREALDRVAALSDGEVARSLRSVTAALRWGRTPSEAWGYVPTAWQPAALAWQVAEAAGAAPAQLLAAAADRVRDSEDRRLEEAAARAGVRLVLPLGLALLPAFACTAVVPVVLALAHTVLGP